MQNSPRLPHRPPEEMDSSNYDEGDLHYRLGEIEEEIARLEREMYARQKDREALAADIKNKIDRSAQLSVVERALQDIHTRLTSLRAEQENLQRDKAA